MNHDFSIGDIVKINGPCPELEVELLSNDGRQTLVRPVAGWGNSSFWTSVACVTLVRKGNGTTQGVAQKIET